MKYTALVLIAAVAVAGVHKAHGIKCWYWKQFGENPCPPASTCQGNAANNNDVNGKNITDCCRPFEHKRVIDCDDPSGLGGEFVVDEGDKATYCVTSGYNSGGTYEQNGGCYWNDAAGDVSSTVRYYCDGTYEYGEEECEDSRCTSSGVKSIKRTDEGVCSISNTDAPTYYFQCNAGEEDGGWFNYGKACAHCDETAEGHSAEDPCNNAFFAASTTTTPALAAIGSVVALVSVYLQG